MSNSAVIERASVSVASITPHPENARKGNVEGIKESLLASGQYRSIVVNKRTMECLAGNHTLKAATELGWDAIDVDFVDASPDAARRILVADNRYNDMAVYDDKALGALLGNMMLAGQLKGTGYNPDQVDDLLSALDALPETAAEEVTAQHAESAEETAARHKEVVPMRQFVLMFPEDPTGKEVESNLRVLKAAWGIESVKDIFAEALRRCIDAGVA